jgi:hypothetical protein
LLTEEIASTLLGTKFERNSKIQRLQDVITYWKTEVIKYPEKNDKIKENDISRECSTHGRDDMITKF